MGDLKLDTILDSVPSPILVECHERVVYANRCYAALLGFSSPAELLGRHISGLVGDVDRQRLVAFSRQRADGRRPPSEYPFVARCRDGGTRILKALVSTTTVADECYITTFVHPVEEATEECAELTKLSARERMVFELLAGGKRPKEIGLLLGISSKTVSTLRGRLMRKLGLLDTWDLFRFVARLRVADRERLAALHSTGLLDTEPEASFDRVTRLAKQLLDVPVAFISFVDRERDFYKSSTGLNSAIREVRGETFCHYALTSNEPLVIEDARAHPLYRTIPIVESLGVGAYLGIPLLFRDQIIGALCVVDFQPRQWAASDIDAVRDLALVLTREIELRYAAHS